MRTLLLALTPIFLVACAVTPYQGDRRPATELPLGSQFTITKPFTIPARELAVYFQLGEVVGPTHGNETEFTCELNVVGRSNQERRIEKGNFTLTENRRYETKVSRSTVIQENRFYLRSPEHPDLDKIFCRASTYPPNFDSLTIAGLREALGDYFRIESAN